MNSDYTPQSLPQKYYTCIGSISTPEELEKGKMKGKGAREGKGTEWEGRGSRERVITRHESTPMYPQHNRQSGIGVECGHPYI